MFLKTLTETITIKNLKLYTETWYVNEKIFNNDDILYIVEKVMKNAIQWQCVPKRCLKLLPSETSNMVCQ